MPFGAPYSVTRPTFGVTVWFFYSSGAGTSIKGAVIGVYEPVCHFSGGPKTEPFGTYLGCCLALRLLMWLFLKAILWGQFFSCLEKA